MCTLAWPESDAQLDALRFLALEVERDSRADSLRFFLVLILLLLPLLLLLLLVVAVALRLVLGNAAHTLLDQRS